jgi:hypothetical protein
MENPIREERTNFLSDSAFENGVHVTGMKTGASSKGDTTLLALSIGSARQRNGLCRHVNPDDIETQLDEVERISPIPAAPVDNLYALRSPGIAI